MDAKINPMECGNSSESLAQAESALSCGDLNAAERLLGVALKAESPPPEAFLLMGVVQNRMGHPDAALTSLQHANSLQPDSGRVHLWLSRTLRKLGRTPEALDQAVHANRLCASDPTVLHELGSCQMECEQFADAARSFREAISLDGSAAVVHYRLGLALSRAGDPSGAASAFRECLRIEPSSETVLSALRAVEEIVGSNQMSGPLAAIEAALASGDLSEADTLCASALKSAPADPGLMKAMGTILIRLGRYTEARHWLERACRTDPTLPEAPIQLAFALQQIGELEKALIAATAGVRNSPSDAEAHVQLGCIYLDLCRYPEAIAAFQAALVRARHHIFAHRALAQALHRSGRYEQEAEVLTQARRLDPGSTEIRRTLIMSLLASRKFEAAKGEAAAFVLEEPESLESRCALAEVHLAGNRTDLASAEISEALKIEPTDAQSAFRAGTILRSLGRIDEATFLMRKSIELKPAQGAAYALLSYLTRANESDLARIQEMKLLSSDATLSVSERADLHFGLGKCYEDLKDYASAITHFDEANRLTYLDRFGEAPFHPQPLVDFTNRLVAVAKSELEEAPGGRALDSDVPILIFGMMRSGTTLMDQILSSHGGVGSVGENRFWVDHSPDLVRDNALHEGRRRRTEIGEEYLLTLEKMAPGVKRVVDKTPANYAFAPIIHSLLPNAKFIHMIRHPADTCLSIYTTMNQSRIEWAHHKEHLAFAYNEYRRLMNCWRMLLPPETMMEVRYEDLVADCERVTRDVLSFCGLPWDDACLSPASNKRAVLTPSAWQVRQPVYTSSVGRWKNYEPWISEFPHDEFR